MKRSQALSVGQIIEQAINRAGVRDTYDRQRICYLWGDITGAAVNRHTVRRWMQGDTLHVVLDSAVLKTDLAAMEDTLVSHLNQAAGRILVRHIAIH